jgi:hypothetical protein
MDLSLLKVASHHELLSLYGALLCELRDRGITRSANNPVADYTEWLAARALGLTLGTKSTAGYDGVCARGFKYEVKGRRRTPQNDSVQLSQIRGLDEQHFDFLIGVIYRQDFSIDYAAQIPYDVVVERAAYRAHTNASVFQLRPDVLRDPRVTDITQRMVDASRAEPPAAV